MTPTYSEMRAYVKQLRDHDARPQIRWTDWMRIADWIEVACDQLRGAACGWCPDCVSGKPCPCAPAAPKEEAK